MSMTRTARAYYQSLVDDLKQPPAFAMADPDAQLVSDVRAESAEIVRGIDAAQRFVIEPDASRMLTTLLDEMGNGLMDMFRETRLPFPAIWIERQLPGQAQVQAALVEQDDDMTTVRFMSQDRGHFSPALSRLEFDRAGEGDVGRHVPTAHLRQGLRSSPEHRADFEAVQEEHELRNIQNFGLAMALSVMLAHPGMIEVSETAPASRADRRRAERKGDPLPATRVSHVRLGEHGRGQLQAMTGEGSGDRTKRRAHWVRGHFMRNRGGGVSWRMPHVRGAGPVIGQERRIHAPVDPDDDPSP